jgi:hypothetical protein
VTPVVPLRTATISLYAICAYPSDVAIPSITKSNVISQPLNPPPYPSSAPFPTCLPRLQYSRATANEHQQLSAKSIGELIHPELAALHARFGITIAKRHVQDRLRQPMDGVLRLHRKLSPGILDLAVQTKRKEKVGQRASYSRSLKRRRAAAGSGFGGQRVNRGTDGNRPRRQERWYKRL